MSIEDFILARLSDAEQQLAKENISVDAWITISRIIANQRAAVEWHKSWPVLLETKPKFDVMADDFENVRYRMSQQITWVTEEEYRKKFGSEPPTAPLLKDMAAVWQTHPDWREDWNK